MRKSLLGLLTILVLLFVSKSCDKDEVETEDRITAADIDPIKGAMMAGDWIITKYFDDNQEETSDYNGYTFKFNADGTLTTTNGNSSLSGAWSVTQSNDGSNDNDSGDVDFNILFSSPEIFQELTDDWDIKSYSNAKIELKDISGGDGGTDLLTFEKL